MKKVLVAVDGSEYSEKVFKYALEEAEELDNELTIVRVVPSFDYGETDIGKADKDEVESARKFTKKLKEKAKEKGVEAETEILTGMDISNTIVKYASEKDFETIVVGGRGKSDLGTIHLGSVAEGVVKRAPCSVLVVH